ncbi:hypothetical protein J6590_072189 [Homalodisca vitripennis]|nr:hypothetical protein J6590_072189 [Homalodisca vitripennis]
MDELIYELWFRGVETITDNTVDKLRKLLSKLTNWQDRGEMHAGISARPLQEVYMDVFGPLLRSLRRDEFILTMVDDFTRCNWVVPPRKVNSGDLCHSKREYSVYMWNAVEVRCGTLTNTGDIPRTARRIQRRRTQGTTHTTDLTRTKRLKELLSSIHRRQPEETGRNKIPWTMDDWPTYAIGVEILVGPGPDCTLCLYCTIHSTLALGERDDVSAASGSIESVKECQPSLSSSIYPVGATPKDPHHRPYQATIANAFKKIESFREGATYNAPKSEVFSIHPVHQINKTQQTSAVIKSSTFKYSSSSAYPRVYYQTQIWLGNYLEPQEFGWVVQNEPLEPITTLLPPAPEELLNTIFCNLQEIRICNGQSCLNASSTSDGFNEESEYAPDILESFYSDTLVNENDDNESDIEQPEEEEK